MPGDRWASKKGWRFPPHLHLGRGVSKYKISNSRKRKEPLVHVHVETKPVPFECNHSSMKQMIAFGMIGFVDIKKIQPDS